MNINPSGKDRFRWIEAVMAAGDLLPAEKLLLARLGLHCNDETGQCDPAEETLAKGIGLSERYVRRMKAAARKKGWLGYEDNPGGRARTSNQYRLLMEKVATETRNGSTGFDGTTSSRNGSGKNPEPQGTKPGTGDPPNTKPTSNNFNGGAAEQETRVRARAWTDAQSLLEAMAQVSGLSANPVHWPRYWKGRQGLAVAQFFIDRYGHFEEAMRAHGHEAIMPIVKAAMAGKRDGRPPNGPKMFEGPLARAFPAVTAIGPTPTAIPKATAHDYSELAKKLGAGARGHELACHLSELEAEQIVDRMLQGVLGDEELHKIRGDLESRAAGARTSGMVRSG